MAAPIKKRSPTGVTVGTTGTLLTGVESVSTLRISTAEDDGTKVLYVETCATVDGGSLVAARAEAYLVSVLPIEIDVTASGPVKLFGDSTFNVIVTAR